MTRVDPIEVASGRSPPSSGWPSATAVARLIGRGVWLWPLVAGIGLWAIGSLVHRGVEREVRRLVEVHLRALQGANVNAVDFWYDRRLDAVAKLAASAGVRERVLALRGGGEAAAVALGEHREAFADYVGAQRVFDVLVVSADASVIASVDSRLTGAVLDEEPAQDAIARALAGKGPVASRPHRSLLPLLEAGRRQTGMPVILLAAPVRGPDGEILGALVVLHRGEALTILLAGSGPTYAVDEAGLLVTGSPHEDQLKRVGLLPDSPGASSVLTVELRDPGVNLIAGGRATQRRSEQSLTRAAASLARGEPEGIDLEGYRDYRGVPVVGTWTWLPTHGLGLVTELEVADAFASLGVIRRFLTGLLVLLGLAALLIMGFTILVRRTAGRTAGPYTILERIGQGAMGTVYRARHALLRRPTAIKVLELGGLSRDSLQRFEREVQATAALRHPNTVTVYDYGRTGDGAFYYAMELLGGVTLEHLVERFGPMPPARVVHVLSQVAGALAEAHAAGLVHRDVKPANVMLEQRPGAWDFVKVLDFGLVTAAADQAKLTGVNQVVGTPLYMAPEAMLGSAPLDARADVHAVGATGYFLLTGAPPYQGTTVSEVLGKVAHAAPRAPSERAVIPPGLEALILRCLSKRPEDRPKDGEALQGELLGLVAETGPWTADAAREWWRKVEGAPGSVTATHLIPAPGGDRASS